MLNGPLLPYFLIMVWLLLHGPWDYFKTNNHLTTCWMWICILFSCSSMTLWSTYVTHRDLSWHLACLTRVAHPLFLLTYPGFSILPQSREALNSSARPTSCMEGKKRSKSKEKHKKTVHEEDGVPFQQNLYSPYTEQFGAQFLFDLCPNPSKPGTVEYEGDGSRCWQRDELPLEVFLVRSSNWNICEIT